VCDIGQNTGGIRMERAIFLEGENVYLRPLDMADLEIFHRWFNDPKLRRFLFLPYPISKLEEKEFLEKMMKSKDSVTLSIVVKEGDRLIGNLGLYGIHKINRGAVLGIAIADLEMTSKGYGTEAMKLMIDYGFKRLNLHRIELTVHEFNMRGLKAYKKLGFVEDGRRREAIYIDGKYHDEIVMSILKQEWARKK